MLKALITSILLLLPQIGFACSPVPPDPLMENKIDLPDLVKSSDLILVGTLKRRDESHNKVLFHVDKVLAGKYADSIIETYYRPYLMSFGMCDRGSGISSFSTSSQYLIFLKIDTDAKKAGFQDYDPEKSMDRKMADEYVSAQINYSRIPYKVVEFFEMPYENRIIMKQRLVDLNTVSAHLNPPKILDVSKFVSAAYCITSANPALGTINTCPPKPPQISAEPEKRKSSGIVINFGASVSPR